MEASHDRPVIRRGTPGDARACNRLLWESATDLGHRHGTPLKGSEEDWWASGEPLQRFLAEHAAEWWAAESPDGQEVGYARSIERGGLFELTELFVRPGEQSRGLGRELIERAFRVGRGEVRSIIATTDVRHQPLLRRRHRGSLPVLHAHRPAEARRRPRHPGRRVRRHR